jgi:peptidoglycan hydrolase-like protein with peptidoglycan-binding domain
MRNKNPLANNPWKKHFRKISNSGVRDKRFVVEFGADLSINQAAQQILNDLGANPQLTVDGMIGPKSQMAIRAFQQDNGVPVTGILDTATLQKLGLAAKPSIFSKFPLFPKPKSVNTLANVRGLNRLSPADMKALIDTANWIGINPDWLASVMSFESGLNPAAVNQAGSGATGLIQFMPSTATALGTSTTALKQMTFQEQLPYVQRYFAPHRGKLHSLEDTYLAVFYPAFIGESDDTVLGHVGSAIYDQNSGFDRDGKGYVTKSDITSTIRGVLASAVGRVTVPGIVVGFAFGGLVASIGIGLAGLLEYQYFKKHGTVWPLPPLRGG